MLACKCSLAPSKSLHPPFVRVISSNMREQLEYRCDSAPSCSHQGQMKLLLSEIEFLTPFINRPLYVIYAGAAPGLHVPILAAMFPTMHFILVDPQRSMISNGQYPNIDVRRELMTDALAVEFAELYSPQLLFISDVRVGPPRGVKETNQEQQIRIQHDMDAQRRWLELMRPLASTLKFRLPWWKGKTNYPSGRIYFPVYGKSLTHEARLVVRKDAPLMDYGNRLYERHMSYFNWKLRPAIQRAFGGGRCYDCTVFRWIVCKYLAASEGCDLGFNRDYSKIDERCCRIEEELAHYKEVWIKQ